MIGDVFAKLEALMNTDSTDKFDARYTSGQFWDREQALKTSDMIGVPVDPDDGEPDRMFRK